MNREAWIPAEIPLDKPNAARVYDYFLGGFHNFEVDRVVGERMLEVFPHWRLTVQINRAFLRRAVHYLADQGIDQFLDVGSGIPTVGNVHQVAQAANPSARVVYVDIDPVAVAHCQAMLAGNPNAIAIIGDLRMPDTILQHPDVRRLLDFSRPLGVLLLTVLHYITDDEAAYSAVARLRDAIVPGSFLAITHTVSELHAAELESQMVATVRPIGDTRLRTHEEIRRFFDDLDLVEPGLVLSPLWRPEGPDDAGLDAPERGLAVGGIGRKP